MSEKVTEKNFDIKESCMTCLNGLKNIFIKPVEAIKDFVADDNFISGIIMIVVAAITAGIYKLATLKRAYDMVNSGWLKAKPEYLKEFFTTFGVHILEYALIVALGYLIVSKIFTGKTTFKQMISTVGISLSLVIIANLINSILVFIDAEAISYIIKYLSRFAMIYSYLIIYFAIKEIGKIDENKLFLSVASMTVCATVTIDILNKLFN